MQLDYFVPQDIELPIYERHSRRVSFPGGNGFELAGILDCPQSPPVATALFTHCFTCNKDLKAIVRISRQLAENGIVVLRYDWTGLGGSNGDFADSTFDGGIADLQAAARFLKSELSGPEYLIGYSLGGAASLAAAGTKTSPLQEKLKGVVTIGAPSNTYHLADLLERMDAPIAAGKVGQVSIGGVQWQIKPALVESLRDYDLQQRINCLEVPLLVVHSEADETVAYSHALKLLEFFQSGRNRQPPAAKITRLLEADHLLTYSADDLKTVCKAIATWIRTSSATTH